MSGEDIVAIIETIGMIMFIIIFVIGLFADEFVKIIRAIRGDDEE